MNETQMATPAKPQTVANVEESRRSIISYINTQRAKLEAAESDCYEAVTGDKQAAYELAIKRVRCARSQIAIAEADLQLFEQLLSRAWKDAK